MRTALTAVVLAFLAAGCSGGSHAAKPYSAADLGWVKRFHKWDERYIEQSQKIQPVYDRLVQRQGDLYPLLSVLRPYRECARSLRSKVGEPEHEQLRRAYELLLEACDEDQKLASRLLESVSPDPLYDAGDLQQKSDWPFRHAYQLIEAGLLVNRSLPVRGGQTDESRIEPRLSRAASALTLEDIEVRCWSTRDWSPTLKEWNAYAGDTGDAAGFVTGSTHANIAPSYCATLARFLYGHWRPANHDDLEEVADAVELVAHEIQHLYETDADEAETECYAAQEVRRLARALGASPSYASQLATVYWRDVYPSDLAEYRSKKCRKNGPYDRHPETSAFP